MAVSGSWRPFRARRGPGGYLGFRRSGSTLGYIPAAASRLLSPPMFSRLPATAGNASSGYSPR